MQEKRKRKKYIWLFFLCMGTALMLCAHFAVKTAASDSEKSRTVRVAFFPMEGYHERALDGSYSGMDAEYLEALSAYTQWNIQYVECQSWDHALEMLLEKQVDLVGSAQYSQSRAEIYAYSDLPAGYTFGAIAVNDQSPIAYEDFRAMKDCTFGVVKTYVRKAEFLEYLADNGVTDPHIKEYEDTARLHEALDNGQVDAIVHTFMEIRDGQRIIGRFSPAPYYYISYRDNQGLIKELNRALSDLKMSDPGLENSLMSKYYSDRLSQKEVLSLDEKEYAQNKQVLRVLYPGDCYPFCYEEDGRLLGMSRTLLEEVKMLTGMNLDFEKVESLQQAEKMLQEGDGDLLAYCTEDEDRLESAGLTAAKIYGTVPLALVVPEGKLSGNIRTMVTSVEVADPKSLIDGAEDLKIISREDDRACMDALIKKEADVALCSSYLSEYLISREPGFEKLELQRILQEELQVSVVVSKYADPALAGILEKSLGTISDKEVNGYILQNSGSRQFTLSQWIHDNSLAIVAVIAVTLLILLLVLMKMLVDSRKIRNLMYRDPEMDIWNLNYFTYWGERYLASEKSRFGIVYMNIVQFKLYNTIYGWVAGNKLLHAMAHVLEAQLQGKRELYARSQGDRFVMMLSAELPEIFETRLQELRRKLEESLCRESGLHMEIRFGVYYPELENRDIKHALSMANYALESAHDKAGGYIQIYDGQMQQKEKERHQREELLKSADIQKDFLVYYQAKTDIRTGKIVGAEALVRFVDPNDGTVRSPGFFISYYEETDQITKIDFFVLETVCKMLRKRLDEGRPVVPVSCNFSRKHFGSTGFADKMEDMLNAYGIPRELVEAEITETVIMEQLQQNHLQENIESLRQKNIRLSIDDFGSGYSSLGVFEQVPASAIKMDRSFLLNHTDRERQVTIMKSIVNLAGALDAQVICEGVETEQDVELMKEVGAYIAQGFYFARPIPENQFEDRLDGEQQ